MVQSFVVVSTFLGIFVALVNIVSLLFLSSALIYNLYEWLFVTKILWVSLWYWTNIPDDLRGIVINIFTPSRLVLENYG